MTKSFSNISGRIEEKEIEVDGREPASETIETRETASETSETIEAQEVTDDIEAEQTQREAEEHFETEQTKEVTKKRIVRLPCFEAE